MIVVAGLIVSRFVHYCAVMVLFGAALFPHYALRNAPRRAADPPPPELGRLMFAAAAVAFFSGATWYLFTTAAMSGRVGAMVDPATLRLVATTAFGRVWMFRLALAAALVVLTIARPTALERAAVLIGSALLVAMLAAVGHGADDGRLANMHRTADAVHLLAAGVWIGALVMLAMMVRAREPDLPRLARALARFSEAGLWVVLALVVTGILNSWILIGPQHLRTFWQEPYGQVLIVKLLLFFAMLLLAALHRFRLVPRLAREGDVATLAALRRTLGAEAALGALVLAAVAALGTLAPPGLS